MALVIFLVLLLLGGAILIGYFSTGRSWSVAATFVDDSVGSMEDYSVVVFSGTASDGASEEGTESQKTQDLFESIPGADDSNIGDRIMSAYYRYNKKQEADEDFVYASDVRDIYELKGASAVSINVSDLSRYAAPTVLSAGEKKFGVFSISSYTSRAQLKSMLRDFEYRGVDSVICIAPRKSLIATFEGIDVVVLTDSGDDDAPERNTGQTLVVRSPEKGSVGVLMFTSNDVPTFRVVEEI